MSKEKEGGQENDNENQADQKNSQTWNLVREKLSEYISGDAFSRWFKNAELVTINEVSILRQSRQAAILSISNGLKNIIKKLVSDGVLVSTPAGSTAYNLSVHGPILSLNSKKLSISPISPFRPSRWKGKIVSDNSKIIIKNLNSIKRPISAVADNIEVRNAKKIIIKTNKKIKFNLLYDQNRSLQKKIKLEQLRKETS